MFRLNLTFLFRAFIVKFLLVYSSIPNSASSETPSAIAPDYKSIFSKAELAVIGQVRSKQEVIEIVNNEKHNCGWVLDISVKKSFKGQIKNFKLFTQTSASHTSLYNDIFIVAFDNKHYLKEGNEASIFCYLNGQRIEVNFEKPDVKVIYDETRIDISDYPYTTGDVYGFINGKIVDQSLFPFDDYAEKKFGEKWIVRSGPDKYNYRGSFNKSYKLRDSEKIIRKGENKTFSTSYTVIKFSDFLKEINLNAK